MTDRDLRSIKFVARHGFASAAQIGAYAFSDFGNGRLDVSMTMVYRRLKKMVDGGLLEHSYVLHGKPGVYLATRAGAGLVDVGVPPAKVDLKSFEHDLAVVDLSLALGGHPDWITEREIRARAVSAARGRGGKISRSGNLGRVPDGLLVGSMGELWAVELEISGKDNARYLEIFEGYAEKHRERIPDERWPTPEDALSDYVRSQGEVDGVAWYFRSESKRGRAWRAAEEAIEADPWREDHCRFHFGDAGDPEPPAFEKFDEQTKDDERIETERRRNTHERRKRSHLANVRLTSEEAEYALHEAYMYKNRGRILKRKLTEEERRQALERGLEAKRERERAAYPDFEG